MLNRVFLVTVLPLLTVIWFMDTNMSLAQSETKAPLQYRVSFRQAETHRVEIEVTVPTENQSTLELMMPVWTPGSYLVREYARHVETISVSDGISNAPLSLEKTSKNRWKLSCPGTTEIVCRYTLYCREMGVRTNWVERDYAFLTGAATFITRADALDRPHIVRLDALPQWPQIATSLSIEGNNPWVRAARNFDELVDSPILLGNIDIQSFEAGGVKHHLATLGTDGLWNTKVAVADVQKIVEIEQKFWGEVPYPEYWFLNLATETGGGLEHDNSTVLMTSRWAMRQKPKYVDWLALVSHEFFHTWNVRRLRPKALNKYDFEHEQYFDELWVAEGITSYYDDLLVARSGLCTPKEYLERVSKNISTVQSGPGRSVQSLKDSSFDTWIKFYRPDENASNSRVNYYTKGSLVAMLLDVEIRYATQNSKSLDDVMRQLWREHRTAGYDQEDFKRIVREIAGVRLDPWLQAATESTQELDFTRLLEWYGLEWKPKESTPEDAKAFGNTFIGMEVQPQAGKAIVTKVLKDSPASLAGINVDDEWISLDGYRVTPEGWTERLNLYRPNDLLSCWFSRRGKMIELKVKLGEQPRETWTLQRVTKPSESQEAHWIHWLQIPSVEEKK